MNRTRHLVSSLHPKKFIQKRTNKRIIMKFAENNGFVYFGHVSQRDDEHNLVRGLTVSPQHHDSHYSVGSAYGYDINLVERTDTIHVPGKIKRQHQWLIFEFDLHASRELPHIFLGHNQHSANFYETLFTKFSRLQKVAVGTFGAYHSSFVQHFSIFTEPAESLAAERLFDQTTAATIAVHFGSLSIEVAENCLYLYTEQVYVSTKLLDTMLKNGLWLAGQLDKNAEHI